MGVRVAREEVVLVVKSKYEIRQLYKRTRSWVYTHVVIGLLGIAGYFLYDPVFISVAAYGFLSALLYYFLEYWREIYASPPRKEAYRNLLRPKLSVKSWLEVGMEIPKEEFLRHVNDRKESVFINEEWVRKHRPYDIISFSKNDIVTHFWFIGTTGAGKTSTILTVINDTLKKGGGAIFIDGKSDVKMLKQMYSIVKENGRESDFLVINFLDPEKRPDTNTFNFISTMSPAQAVEFLVSLLPEVGGDGSYWQGRGKALLKSVVFPLAFRRRYYNEPLSYESLRQYMQWENMVFLVALVYATMKKVSALIDEKREKLGLMLKRMERLGFFPEDFKEVAGLRSLLIQYPYEKERFDEVMSEIPDASSFILDLYEAYTNLTGYISELSSTYMSNKKPLFEHFASMVQEEILTAPISRIREQFNAFLETVTAVSTPEGRREVKVREVINNIKDEALKQLGYGQQQWTDIFTRFGDYSHIYGAMYPDIDMVDVIRNNKILYILLPSLEKSRDSVEFLGKMILIAVKQATARSLGSDLEMTSTKSKILEAKITPKPLFTIIADEYGSYALQDTETLLAQVRSLNIGMIISTQDYTSSRTMDNFGERAAQRLWANSKKFILRIEDDETMRKIKELLSDELVVRRSIVASEYGGYDEEIDAHVETASPVGDVDFMKMSHGLGVFVYEGEAIFAQMFYYNPPGKDVEINKLTVLT